MNEIAQEFNFLGYDLDGDTGRVLFRYQLLWDKPNAKRGKELTFTETFLFGSGYDWDLTARKLLDVLYFVAGVSYYKAGLPSRLNFKNMPVSSSEAALTAAVYSRGLEEMAYRNNLELPGLSFFDAAGAAVVSGSGESHPGAVLPNRPSPLADPASEESIPEGGIKVLLPFGGGIDSLTSLELLRHKADEISLFVMSRLNDRYAAIENAAEAAKLPVVRLERQLDEKILDSVSLGLLNGHVPITAVISAAAVVSAHLNGFNHAVMSNEKSASSGSVLGDKTVNHQWSKGIEFEAMLHAMVKDVTGGAISYFSLLRPLSELWIARRFVSCDTYLPVFRSCNRAFHIDPGQRLDKWCGVCDKCCFIDLILAPFLSKYQLEEIFAGAEPLSAEANHDRFLALLGLYAKPFECVGDVTECRAALQLALERDDRKGDGPAESLAAAAAAPGSPNLVTEREIEELMHPSGENFIPGYLRDVFL